MLCGVRRDEQKSPGFSRQGFRLEGTTRKGDWASRMDWAWLGAADASRAGDFMSPVSGASARAANSFPIVVRHESSFG
jgi:hypothetical protein